MAVLVIGTCDTKAAELAYARDCIRAAGVAAQLVDVGTRGGGDEADVTAAEVAGHHPDGAAAVLGTSDRGVAVTAMAAALTRYLATRGDIDAVLGLGGTGNTALVTAALRALPVGLPKLMVSTVASGNVAPYVGATDITMMHSVVDIAGLNAISRRVIANAAHAVAGMATWRAVSGAGDRPAIGMTMFGVTTPCVTEVRRLLEQDHDCLVFHATGTGGQSMEKLAEGGFLRGVIDATTTEVADYPGRRRLRLQRGPLRRDRPHRPALCRVDRRRRHGEFRRDGDGAGDVPRPAPACSQRPGDADADDGGGECGDRRLDRRAAQPLPRAGALPAAARRRLGHRRARPALP